MMSALSTWTPAAYGIWTGVLMGAGWILKEWRENRKLSLEDRLARRGGYEKQVAALTAENRAVMEDLRLLREEYDTYRRLCHEETDTLRKDVIRLEDEMNGYKRRLDTQARDMGKLSKGDA